MDVEKMSMRKYPLFLLLTFLACSQAVSESPTAVDEMALIPAGEFLMGSSHEQIHRLLEADPKAYPRLFETEQPQHPVHVDAFYIDKYEVADADYRRFMQATGHQPPKYWTEAPSFGAATPFPVGSKNSRHPVVGVSWENANAYCQWAGKRLPTEAEWEKAARGGLVGKQYPWGDGLSHDDVNQSGVGGKDRWHWTAPVGSFPPNGYGLYDMAGNAFEWCADWYAPGYYATSPRRNPEGPAEGMLRVVRGGSWDNNLLNVYYLRVAFRYYARPQTQNMLIGFRCVRDADSAEGKSP